MATPVSGQVERVDPAAGVVRRTGASACQQKLTPSRLSSSKASLGDRRSLLMAFDRMHRALDARGEMAAVDQYTARAFDMISSPAVRDAFDLNKEPHKLREKYGADHRFKIYYQNGHTWHKEETAQYREWTLMPRMGRQSWLAILYDFSRLWE